MHIFWDGWKSYHYIHNHSLIVKRCSRSLSRGLITCSTKPPQTLLFAKSTASPGGIHGSSRHALIAFLYLSEHHSSRSSTIRRAAVKSLFEDESFASLEVSSDSKSLPLCISIRSMPSRRIGRLRCCTDMVAAAGLLTVGWNLVEKKGAVKSISVPVKW